MASEPAFEWQSTIEKQSVGAGLKTIAISEIDPTRSNKHSFHGVIPFRKLLGDQRVTFHARFVYAAQDKSVFSESFVTWYDDCEFNPNPKCKNQWRLYYPDTLVISKARPGDVLLVARIDDDELILVITPQGSPAAQWINKRYTHDPRLKDLAPPEPANPSQISLPQSFTQAKKIMARHVYANDNERQTFYCGCNYSREGKIDPLSCGYTPRKAGSKRAERLEWEHIVPAAYIGKGRTCWEKGDQECKSSNGKSFKGRRCCKKVDAEFRAITADLNNLVPEIGEMNADRSNFPYREISGEARVYGSCDFEVDTKLKEAEPAVQLRGFIGRTWLYMHDAYNVFITDEDRRVYTAWARQYPPEQWEIERRERIRKALQPAHDNKNLVNDQRQ